MWSGVMVSLAGSVLTGSAPPDIAWHVGLPVLLLVPTVLQPWVQIKAFKMVSRFLLGVTITWWLLGLVYVSYPLPWFVTLCAQLLIPIVVGAALLRLRNRRPDNPCVECDQGFFPACDWNMENLLRDAPELPVDGSGFGGNLVVIQGVTGVSRDSAETAGLDS